jgi:hypothetical protein
VDGGGGETAACAADGGGEAACVAVGGGRPQGGVLLGRIIGVEAAMRSAGQEAGDSGSGEGHLFCKRENCIKW